MLDNAMVRLGVLPNAIMPDGVVRHVTPIDEESQATHVSIGIHPAIAERPEINCLFEGVTEVQIASGHFKHDWAFGIVLHRIFGLRAAFELADVCGATSALIAAFGAPPIPDSGEDCSMDSGSHFPTQLDKVLGNQGAIMTRRPIEAIWHVTPSFDLAANTLDSRGGGGSFNRLQSKSLKVALVFIELLLILLRGRATRNVVVEAK